MQFQTKEKPKLTERENGLTNKRLIRAKDGTNFERMLFQFIWDRELKIYDLKRLLVDITYFHCLDTKMFKLYIDSL